MPVFVLKTRKSTGTLSCSTVLYLSISITRLIRWKPSQSKQDFNLFSIIEITDFSQGKFYCISYTLKTTVSTVLKSRKDASHCKVFVIYFEIPMPHHSFLIQEVNS